ncbi:RNA polymerase sigma factor [Pedobacter terrae]|uniref:RNA polymerase sigma factor n=1 Tax=Pedobacter terrae TaxID=405671 RepID=UPI002FF5D275
MTEELTEKDRIHHLKNGQDSAFRWMFDQHFKKIYAFCFRLLKNRELAEEVCHDALLSVWVHRAKLNEDLPLAPYLYTITRRLTLNALRNIATSEKMMNQLWLDIEKVSNNTEESVMLSDLKRFTTSSIAILPAKQQLVFKLSRYDGLNYDEIGEKLGISRNTVKNHLIAALKTLRNHFNTSDMGCFLVLCSFLMKK